VHLLLLRLTAHNATCPLLLLLLLALLLAVLSGAASRGAWWGRRHAAWSRLLLLLRLRSSSSTKRNATDSRTELPLLLSPLLLPALRLLLGAGTGSCLHASTCSRSSGPAWVTA
jgi:hypothetical protein